MVSMAAVEFGPKLTDGCYPSFLALVSPERKNRAAAFKRREDACRCVIAEVLARYCIAGREKVPPEAIVFQNDNFGKPFVELPGKTQFNISHSDSLVVCATDDGPIGIDIERIHAPDFEMAKRFFHPDEFSEMTGLPNRLRTKRFFELWTLKESYIKALGKGLSCPLDSFSMLLDRDKITVRAGQDGPALFFKLYDFGPDYKCSLCLSHDKFPEKVEAMSPEKLLEKINILSGR
jgi:4'-phosphopantetheinyl transferase